HAVGPFETAEYERTVRELARQLGLETAVTWVGFTSNVAAEFKHMQVFALPSLYGEGMPMVVLEAMAVGLPIVSTRVEGIPQVVREGVDRLLAAPGNPEELAGCLLRFIHGEVSTQDMGTNAWQRQRERFSDVSMANGVAAVYREVLQT